MNSAIFLANQWVDCQIFYPSPFFVRTHIHYVGGAALILPDAFDDYNTKIILPRFIHMENGCYDVTHHQIDYHFFAQDTFHRADRSIYGTLRKK